MGDKKAVFTTGEVAKICGVTLRTVVNWIQRGQLEAYKLPGTRGDNRITEENFRSFLLQNNFPLPAELETDAGLDEVKKILVVDDDPPMANAIARLLRQQGFRVSVAYDGFDAGLQFVKFAPDLVTLDLNMPKMDGMFVLKRLTSEERVPRVVVISGEGEIALRAALDAGADAAFSKPFDQEALLSEVANLIGEK